MASNCDEILYDDAILAHFEDVEVTPQVIDELFSEISSSLFSTQNNNNNKTGI